MSAWEALSISDPFPGRCTLAIKAGVSDLVWTTLELVGILEVKEKAMIGTEENRRGPYKKTQPN